MKHLVLILLLATPLHAQAIPPAPHPECAVVRIKSHGASATIIWTSKDKSYLLGCAHMLEDSAGKPSPEARKKKLIIDGFPQPHAPKKLAEARLIAFDHALDLSLIELDNGPFHFIPVAPKGHKPARNLRSIGYDNLTWPITSHFATLLSVEGFTTFTREKPWHGRSGGGLIDCQHKVLIGVVQGYEVSPTGRGVYISHHAVLTFLEKHRPDLIPNSTTPDSWPLSRRWDRCPPKS